MPTSIVTGTGPHSLGMHILQSLCNNAAMRPIIGIDRGEHGMVDFGTVPNWQFDLNPLKCVAGFDEWSRQLDEIISTDQITTRPTVTKNLVLCASIYHVDSFLNHPRSIRMEILGTNVVGKCELVHAIMTRNSALDADNATALTVVDVGSLHGLQQTPSRIIYNSSKRWGLDLCRALAADHEIARAWHIAPSALDTPMLHRNHWVLKERGDPMFWSHVIQSDPGLYDSIFRHCSRDALRESAYTYDQGSLDLLVGTMRRYERRRNAQISGAGGIIDPQVLAKRIVSMLNGKEAHPSGIYAVAASACGLSTTYTPFQYKKRASRA